jgi:spore coat protein H
VLHFVDITVAEADLEALENDRENRVPCDIRFDGELIENSGIRQKGGIGSVSSLNGKPGFSIKFNEFERGQDLASLEKLVLNNAIQDRTLVHEHMGYELARRAGIPASRTAHAIVTLNGYTYGIYVVAESVDDDFLRRWFGEDQDTGNLYEGPCCADFVQDIEHMELDDEDDGRTRDDLIELARIVREVPDAELPAALEAELDMRSFILGYALDAAVFHWDGYAFNVNNHYIYRRPADDRFVFMPHGMDQLFQDVNFDPQSWPNGRLAQRVRELPAYDALYREALAFIATDVWDTDAMHTRLDTVRRTLATAPRGLETVERDLRWFEESLPFVRAEYAIRKAVLHRGNAPPAPEVCTEITDGRARFAPLPAAPHGRRRRCPVWRARRHAGGARRRGAAGIPAGCRARNPRRRDLARPVRRARRGSVPRPRGAAAGLRSLGAGPPERRRGGELCRLRPEPRRAVERPGVRREPALRLRTLTAPARGSAVSRGDRRGRRGHRRRARSRTPVGGGSGSSQRAPREVRRRCVTSTYGASHTGCRHRGPENRTTDSPRGASATSTSPN